MPRQVAECGVACCWPAPTISRLRSGRGVSPVSHVIRPPTPRVFRHQHHATAARNGQLAARASTRVVAASQATRSERGRPGNRNDLTLLRRT